MDSTTLVLSSFTSTLLGTSCSVSLLSRDKDFGGSSGPAVGHTGVTGSRRNPKSSPRSVPGPDLGWAAPPRP